jgi:small subunit ribosomal protein S13
MNQELHDKKPVYYSLTGIYGIGKVYSTYILRKAGFSKNFMFSKLSEKQLLFVINIINNQKLKTSKDLKKNIYISIKKLIDIKTYRGLRRLKKLPLRGQRTRTNAKTAKKHNN